MMENRRMDYNEIRQRYALGCQSPNALFFGGGGRRMHFVMYAFNTHVEVLHNVTPIETVGQSAQCCEKPQIVLCQWDFNLEEY